MKPLACACLHCCLPYLNSQCSLLCILHPSILNSLSLTLSLSPSLSLSLSLSPSLSLSFLSHSLSLFLFTTSLSLTLCSPPVRFRSLLIFSWGPESWRHFGCVHFWSRRGHRVCVLVCVCLCVCVCVSVSLCLECVVV